MLKILIVQDDAGAARDLTTFETRFQDRAKFRRAGDLDTAIDYLDRGDVSCILLDEAFTENGRDAYGTLRHHFPEVPILRLIGEDGHTRLLEFDGGLSGHVEYGTTDAEIFNRVSALVERVGPRSHVPSAAGRLGPEDTTKPPRPPKLPVDIVEAAATLPATEVKPPVDDLPSRVRALEEAIANTAGNLRFVTWVVAILVASAVIALLRN